MTEQEMREKVIKELECCVNLVSNGPKCANCDYADEFHNGDCETYLLRDALALLKAQEPRLIKAEDFENNPDVDHDGFLPAWIEYRRDGDWDEYWEGQPDEWGVCKADRTAYESMRYWTSRPSNERMKAVKWDD